MAQVDNDIVERYFYRSATTSRRHRNLVSAYLVERCYDSNIVARIEPLGLVSRKVSEHEIALRGLRRNLVLVGQWRPTASLHHHRVRVQSLGTPRE
jgi:hypothetical protein